MNIIEITKTSLTALWVNKIRSSLTMLGVIIGVASVILLISIGRGIQNYITDQFEALGSNLIFIMPGKTPLKSGRDPVESFGRNKLEAKHVKILKTQAGKYIKEITGGVQIGEVVKYKTKSFYASIAGGEASIFPMQNYIMEMGKPFTPKDVKAKAKVAVLGPKVVKKLFPNTNPVGLKIKIEKNTYEVIGVFKSKGRSYDEQILIPITSIINTFDIKNYSFILLSLKDNTDANIAIKQIKRDLLRDLKENEFSVTTQNEILGTIQEILGMLTLALGAIAAISLFVGGIGIMNIMLVSVTERTREIGLRKALGATPNNITTQFLIESLSLSVGGGIIGIILGSLLSLSLRSFLRTEVPWWSILLAFSFSVFVGVVFGTYPAIKAGKKDPIESLRYE